MNISFMHAYGQIFRLIILAFILHGRFVFSWITRENSLNFIQKFEELEIERKKLAVRGHDRRSSAPFISGDTFRAEISHICEDSNRCRMDPTAVTNGSCIFVKTDMFDFFVKEVSNRIPGSYIIVSHNGDLSSPDGQDDAPRIGMPRFITSDILTKEYNAGRLIAHHGQNLWWKNYSLMSRPAYSHCLPIGIENRQYSIGKKLHIYIEAFKHNFINSVILTNKEKTKHPLLLVAFYPKSRVPDRQKVLSILGAIPPRGQSKPKNTWYNETDLNHREWLDAIVHHRFVLAPFGHGLDTHRITEILLMGGIPVTRRSTISSCYDDSDNAYFNPHSSSSVKNAKARGSLPIVILDSWQELTKERLELEWTKFISLDASRWDYSRLFVDHWRDRIGCSKPPQRDRILT